LGGKTVGEPKVSFTPSDKNKNEIIKMMKTLK
jgi:hypothetical protein